MRSNLVKRLALFKSRIKYGKSHFFNDDSTPRPYVFSIIYKSWKYIRFIFGFKPTQGEKHHHYKNTQSFESYFVDKQILKVLCKRRIIDAKKQHDKLFFINLKGGLNSNKNTRSINIFPSRNTWFRLNKKERGDANSIIINAKQLERTVLSKTKTLKDSKGQLWAKNLISLIREINLMANSPNFKIEPPQISPIFKEEKNGLKIFRPISNFEEKERIIISQTSKYLTECFDYTFENCSYAFRSKSATGISFTHHKAIEDLIKFRKDRPNQDLWVAECDIKKFFDCVNHNILTNIFYCKIVECELKGIYINKQAIHIFHAYLNCYSFNDYVKINESNLLPPNSEFGWVSDDELLYVKSNKLNDRIGVPQGGALSCLIANLIMDYVDKEVLKHQDGNLFYARFCDDMIILHPDKEICNQVLKSYQRAIKEMKLLVHDPEIISTYSKEFWKSKSKSPYKWESNAILESNVPWLSFVGYQIRYDLTVRVRKSSLRKEIEKQIKESDKLISLVKKNRKFIVSQRAIKFRIRQRLFAMSVGRVTIYNNDKKGQLCWTAGFRVLNNNNNIQFQIRHLDRKRGAQFKRIDNWLNKLNCKNRPDKNENVNEIKKAPKYYGYPFSYYKQING
jgi:hypothetical protein